MQIIITRARSKGHMHGVLVADVCAGHGVLSQGELGEGDQVGQVVAGRWTA
jgi:predicted RNA methylase